MKSQITDEQIYTLIDQGMKNSEIARKLGVSQPAINKRINILRSTVPPRPEKPVFDLVVDQRIKHNGKILVVISVEEDGFAYRRMDGTTGTISNSFYFKHRGEFQEFHPDGDPAGPVISYKISPDKPAKVIEENEKILDELFPKELTERIVPTDDIDPAYAFDHPEPPIFRPDNYELDPPAKTISIEERIMLQAKRRLEEFAEIKARLRQTLEAGEAFDPTLINQFNSYAEQYGGYGA